MREVYLFEDGLEVINHRVWSVSLGLTRGNIYAFHFAEAAPLTLLFEFACMRMLMLGEDGGKWPCVQDALESGIEEASVSEVVETASNGQLAHVEGITKFDR